MNNIKYLVVLLLIFCDCSEEQKVEIPDFHEEIKDFRLTEMSGDLLKWELSGNRAVSRRDTIIVYEVNLTFFNNEGNVSSTLRSDSGFVIEKTNDLTALGDIVIKTADSVTLWTQKLNWIEEEEKITTDREVRYKKDGKLYRGTGMESDPDLKHIKIKKNFRGEGEFE